MQQIIGDDDTVSGSETMLDPFGKIQRLFNTDQRVRAEFLCLSDLLHDECGVGFCRLLHFTVIPGQVACGIAGVPAECFLHQILAESVGIRALLRVWATLVFHLSAQLG